MRATLAAWKVLLRQIRLWRRNGSRSQVRGCAKSSVESFPVFSSGRISFGSWPKILFGRGACQKLSRKMAHAIIESVRRENSASLQEQLDYAVRLVSWSTVACKCGVQIELIDVLADAGASLAGNPDNALVNGNIAAAEHLVRRGAPLTLATALCLERCLDVQRLAANAGGPERQFALVLAALNGKAEALRQMIRLGVDVNTPSQDLYSHGTPLHHAVCSGCLEAVQVLVEAGANLHAQDTAWHGSPLGWALHYVEEKKQEEERARSEKIAAYLRQAIAETPASGTL